MQGRNYYLLTNEKSEAQKGTVGLIRITELVSFQNKDLEIHHWIIVEIVQEK